MPKNSRYPHREKAEALLVSASDILREATYLFDGGGPVADSFNSRGVKGPEASSESCKPGSRHCSAYGLEFLHTPTQPTGVEKCRRRSSNNETYAEAISLHMKSSSFDSLPLRQSHPEASDAIRIRSGRCIRCRALLHPKSEVREP